MPSNSPKTKKTRLEIDYGFDFDLIGLRSAARPHKLAWDLNQALNISLSKSDDHLLISNDQEIPFFNFLYQTPLSSIRLLRNRASLEPTDNGTKWLLAPEHPEFDFFLVCTNRETNNTEDILKATKNIPTIEWSAFLPLAAFRSKENFIFF